MIALALLVAAAALASPVASPPASPAPAGDASPAPQASAPVERLATPPPVDGLTVAEIRKRWRAASGTGATVPHEIRVWKTRTFGVDGSLRHVALGDDWLETERRGSFESESGENGGKAWQQNENGLVILKQREPADADVRGVSETLTRVHDPIDAYVIEITAANGSTTRTFYDAKTFHIVRRERTTESVRSYVVYEDFQTDAAGRSFARHVYGGDQRSNNEWDDRLVSVDLTTPVTAADVSIPQNRRTLVTFPEGKNTVALPARIVHGLIVVRVQIGARGVDFVLDSGADSIVLDTKVASELGLELQGSHTETIAGDYSTSTIRIPQMKVGDLVLNDVAVDALPLSFDIDDQTKAAGLLGFDFLSGVVVAVDYRGERVTATKPDSFTPAAGASAVDVRMNNGVPETELQIGSSKGDRFIIDTGDQLGTVAIFPRFIREHSQNIDPSAKHDTNSPILREMIGGTVEHTQVVFADITFGPWVLGGVRGLMVRSKMSGLNDIDGLIGSGLLDNFYVTIDEPHSKIYLEQISK